MHPAEALEALDGAGVVEVVKMLEGLTDQRVAVQRIRMNRGGS